MKIYFLKSFSEFDKNESKIIIKYIEYKIAKNNGFLFKSRPFPDKASLISLYYLCILVIKRLRNHLL